MVNTWDEIDAWLLMLRRRISSRYRDDRRLLEIELTREVAARLAGLDEETVDRLAKDGIVKPSRDQSEGPPKYDGFDLVKLAVAAHIDSFALANVPNSVLAIGLQTVDRLRGLQLHGLALTLDVDRAGVGGPNR